MSTRQAMLAAQPLPTHWTRLFYRDLDAPWRVAEQCDVAHAPRAARAGVGPRTPFARRSPTMAGALLLGFYVALYLAVAGVLRVIASDGAIVAHPAGSSTERPESASAPPRDAMPPVPRIA